jgi:hypothetical protein
MTESYLVTGATSLLVTLELRSRVMYQNSIS